MICLDLVATVLTQRVALPLGGEGSQVSLAFLIHFAAIAYLLVHRLVIVPMARVVLFCALVACACLVNARFPIGALSSASLWLMLSTSAMFLFVVPLSMRQLHEVMGIFVALALATSGLVAVDWLTQAMGFAMPDMDQFLPEPLNYSAYVYLQPLRWDSPWMKPNAFFFLEASHVSQFLGIGLIIELAFFRRAWAAAGIFVAMMASFGGTGMILVLCALPALFMRQRATTALGTLLAGSMVVVALNASGAADLLLERVGEFSRGNSSANHRFILPAERFVQVWNDRTGATWFGTGAGTMPKAVNNPARGTIGLTWPPYTKVTVEYGIVGLITWSLFFVSCMFGSGGPFVIAWVGFVQYAFLNGSLNVPLHSVYCWFLGAGFVLLKLGAPARSAASAADVENASLTASCP